jgi:hypothetical protein
MRIILLIFSFFCLFSVSMAQSADSTEIKVKHFSETELAKARADKDFDYKEGNGGGQSILGRLLLYGLIRLLEWFGNPYIKFPFMALAAALLVFYILKANINSVFVKNQKIKQLDWTDMVEQSNEINFEQLVNEAIGKKDFHSATRYLYLQCLFRLHHKGLLVIEKNKTATDYGYELTDHEVRNNFRRFARLYEYVHYGEFPVEETQFAKIKEEFVKLNS